MTPQQVIDALKAQLTSERTMPDPRVVRVAPDETAQSQYPQEEEGEEGTDESGGGEGDGDGE